MARVQWPSANGVSFIFLAASALVLSTTGSATSAAAAAAAAEDGIPCAPKITFFPPGSEDKNFPTVWGRMAQLAAGNMNSSRMFSVIMPSASRIPGTRSLGYPTLQVYPIHDLLVLGRGNISEECLGYNSGTSFPGPEKAEDLVVTVPPRYRVEYEFNGTSTVTAGEYQQPLGTGTIPQIVLNQLATYPDAYYCLTIRVVVVGWSGMIQHVAVPAKDLVTSQQVCFYKMDGLPTGQANFTTCGKEFEVSISGVKPHPIPLYPGSDVPLFNPVIHMRSDLNRTKDWSWPENGARTKFDHWRVLSNVKPYSFVPEVMEGDGEGELFEGWWNVKLEVSLLSQYPTLLVPNLLSAAATYNDTLAPEALRDQPKYMAAEQYPPGTVMGIQHSPTRFKTLEGPSSEFEILPNQEVTFSWEFDGFGYQNCYVDGEQVDNAAEHTCMSPMNVRVPSRKNHTFTVELQDVCGKNFTVEAVYSTWGYQLSKVPTAPLADGNTTASVDGEGTSDGAVFEIAPVDPATLNLRGIPGSGRRPSTSGADSFSLFSSQWYALSLCYVAVAALLNPG